VVEGRGWGLQREKKGTVEARPSKGYALAGGTELALATLSDRGVEGVAFGIPGERGRGLSGRWLLRLPQLSLISISMDLSLTATTACASEPMSVGMGKGGRTGSERDAAIGRCSQGSPSNWPLAVASTKRITLESLCWTPTRWLRAQPRSWRVFSAKGKERKAPRVRRERPPSGRTDLYPLTSALASDFERAAIRSYLPRC